MATKNEISMPYIMSISKSFLKSVLELRPVICDPNMLEEPYQPDLLPVMSKTEIPSSLASKTPVDSSNPGGFGYFGGS